MIAKPNTFSLVNRNSPVRRTTVGAWMKWALLFAVLLPLGGCSSRARRESQCIADAEKAVAEYLQKHPSPTLGDFQKLDGEGFDGPSWGNPVGFYLQARRVAHFTKGQEAIVVYVHPGKAEEPEEVKVFFASPDRYQVSHRGLTPR